MTESKSKDNKLLAIGHSMGGILLYGMLSRCGKQHFSVTCYIVLLPENEVFAFISHIFICLHLWPSLRVKYIVVIVLS